MHIGAWSSKGYCNESTEVKACRHIQYKDALSHCTDAFYSTISINI
jgi:hypothetical protein